MMVKPIKRYGKGLIAVLTTLIKLLQRSISISMAIRQEKKAPRYLSLHGEVIPMNIPARGKQPLKEIPLSLPATRYPSKTV